jgi:4-hydroxybenzoate polyprenyl transferase
VKKIKIFIELTRLNKPIGIMLLFWPCLWGLTLSYHFNIETNLYLKYLILFLLGSVLMRSAGCIFNDIVDRDLDKKVLRTKKRPIASGKISVSRSLIYAIILCLIAFLILLQFNLLTIILGLGSMFLAFSYPFMKRITYWPQLFLGLTFNWGIIMSWTLVTNSISIEPIILYIAAIFWTLGYDTIYGLQDIRDDEIIGVKSTSIKFKNNTKTFVGFCYSLSILMILLLYFMMEIDKYLLILSTLFLADKLETQ